jgi:hypothetical protein
MYIEKRESNNYEIYYIWWKITPPNDTIIGFIMETTDQGFDVIFNQRRVFLIREYASLIKSMGKIEEFKQTVMNYFNTRQTFKGKETPMTPTHPVTSFFFIDSTSMDNSDKYG